MPSAAELPRIELDRTVTPTPVNPLGVKGIGEAGTIAATAAGRQRGRRRRSASTHLDMPLQPEQRLARHRPRGRIVIPDRVRATSGRRRVAEAVEAARAPRRRRQAAGRRPSLIPLMKLRLARPSSGRPVGRSRACDGIREDGDHIAIGALTTHHAVARVRPDRAGVPGAGPGGRRRSATCQVRNRGTIGGSLAHADPHADLPAALLALGGEVVAEGPGGRRTIAADELFLDYLTHRPSRPTRS